MHFPDFPVAAPRQSGESAREPSVHSGERTVVSERLYAGVGGILVVTMILLAVEMISGVQAFPL